MNAARADSILSHVATIPAVHSSHRSLPELRGAKVSFVARHWLEADAARLLTANVTPEAGDLVLARVERIGQHGGLQLRSGRRASLFAGDTIVVAYGARYAPDQFEAVVPNDMGPCDLVAAGGLAARVLTAHRKMRSPTRLQPLGLLADGAGAKLNLRAYQRARPIAARGSRVPVLAVVGSSMNAGKTTAASALIRGLSRSGRQVGAVKLTGTGSSGDISLMLDSGAVRAVDFTDAGYASTYMADLESLAESCEILLDHLTALGSEIIVAEIADGLLQRETGFLLRHRRVGARLDGVLFAAQDALGAVGGVEWLERLGLPALAVTGLLTASPLATREATDACGIPVLGPEALADASTARDLLDKATSRALRLPATDVK